MDHLSVSEDTVKFATFSTLKSWPKAVILKIKLKQLRQRFKVNIRQVDTDNKRAEITRIYVEEVQALVTELDILTTFPLIKKAGKLGIDVLPEWTRDNNPESELYRLFRKGYVYNLQLTPAGKGRLRSAIWQKRRESVEWWVKRVIIPLIIALTGLAGALIGILAMLRK
ncbi:MAG: hypothetical protein J2P31_15035 [Blastocatellia bacterium]|nr:hypothetical protein [Blastocatellia bacterium]